jgi:hypothetical protein
MRKTVVVVALCATWLGCPPTPPAPPPTVTCAFNAAKVCGGTCPAGQQCSSPSPTVCACVAADGGTFCAFNAAKVCGGPCPPGQTCTTKGATVCACFPAGDSGG